MPRRFGFAASCVLALAAVGCRMPNQPAGTAGPPVTSSPTDAPAEYAVGERIRIGDEQFFAILQVDLDVKEDGIFKPPDGKKWVAVLAEIEGIDPAGATYNPLFFTLRAPDGFEYTFSLLGKGPKLQSSDELGAGEKVRGWVTFEIPKGAANLLLIYEAGFLAREVRVPID